MTNQQWKILSSDAKDRRDKSMADIEKYFPLPAGFKSKHTDPLPDPLPLNVTSFPKKYLDPFDYTIISTTPIVLLKELAEKKYTSVQVTGAFLRCAVLAQKTLNHVTEFLPEMAFEMASKCDAYLEEHGKTIGPLHGLPFSLKDMICLKGYSNSFAAVALTTHITDWDSLIVEIVRDAGAVFYQRTNQPQALMHLECENNIFGATLNPYNRNLTCGGSSGGEGASLGFGSSCIGLGTDIGGSIRNPAAMQGAFGLKLTSNRLPLSDTFCVSAGAEAIAPAIGPMGRSVEIIDLVTKVIVAAEPWKVYRDLSNKPWDNDGLKGKKKLVVGIQYSDGVVTPQPPMQRALKEAAEKLKAVGSIDGIEIEIKEYKPFKQDLAWEIISGLYFEDGAVGEIEIFNSTGEPILPLTEYIFNQKGVKNLTIPELWERNKAKHQYRVEYNKHFLESGVDVIITPAYVGPPQPHTTADNLTTTWWGYTSIFNTMDMPSCTFGVTYVDQEKDKPIEGYTPINDIDKAYYERYTPELFADAPVSLQVAAARSEDELLVEATKLISKVLREGYAY